MTAQEIENELRKATKLSEPTYFIGTTAYHLCGEISSPVPDIFRAHSHTESYYIGEWVRVLGFVKICFPKLTSRRFTRREVEFYNDLDIQLPDGSFIRLKNVK